MKILFLKILGLFNKFVKDFVIIEFAKPKILIFLLALLYSVEWVGWFILRNKIKDKVSYFSIGLATKILPYSGTIPLYINFASKTDYLLINRTILEF